jgi:hypothetical protein
VAIVVDLAPAEVGDVERIDRIQQRRGDERVSFVIHLRVAVGVDVALERVKHRRRG